MAVTKRDNSKVWIDAAGRRRTITPLQQKIMYFRLEPDNVELPVSEVARRLKVSYTAVKKTEKNPVCIAFAESIKAMVDQALVMGIEEKRKILAEIGRSDVTQFVDRDGNIELTAENPNKRAVAEYEVTRDIVGSDDDSVIRERRKIKLVNRLEAIDLDNKILNLYRTDTQVNINNDNRSVTIVVKSEEGKQSLERLQSGQLPGKAGEGRK